MSLRDCIAAARKAKSITKAQAEEAEAEYDYLFDIYRENMSDAAASQQATREALGNLEAQLAREKYLRLRQIEANIDLVDSVEKFRDFRNRKNVFSAATQIFASWTGSGTRFFDSVEMRQEAILRMLHARMGDSISAFYKKITGGERNVALQRDVARELYGQSSGSEAARAIAKGISDMLEYARLRYNQAGGMIAKLDNFGLPQLHDALRIRNTPLKKWKQFVFDRLDFSKMRDFDSGELMTREEVWNALDRVYETIVTDGTNKMEPSSQRGARSLANRRLEHRFLHFKDADAWLEYNDAFGQMGIFDNVLAHAENMARDIGLMEKLGPNPDAGVRFLKSYLKKATGGDPKKANQLSQAESSIDTFMDHLTGKANRPANVVAAKTMAGVRQIPLQAAQLGSATLSAVTDPGFAQVTLSFNGLPASRLMADYFRSINPADPEIRRQATRLGLIAEDMTMMGSSAMRHTLDAYGPELGRRTSEFVMRASFLNQHTAAIRRAFGFSFQGGLADMAGKSWGDLNFRTREMFERYGLTADDWDVIRTTQQYEPRPGARFLSPVDVEARTDLPDGRAYEVATKYMNVLNGETSFAVPSNTIRGRALMVGASRPGTLHGELMRSVGMYKAFAAAVLTQHGGRLLQSQFDQRMTARRLYPLQFIVTTTVLGGLAIQLKELSKGKDPRDMNTKEFWGAAMLQGGGLGLFGDLLFSDVNRFGGGIGATIGGPVVGLVDDINKLTIGNLQQAVLGEDTKFLSELGRFAQRYTPGTSIWYKRLALERELWNQIQLATDPDAPAKFRRLETRTLNDYGQRYWWAPGETRPERAPDLGAALGN